MIDAGMVIVSVLARLQAEDRKLSDLTDGERQTMIDEAIADLHLADELVQARSVS